MDVTEQGFLIQRDQKVNPINVRSNIPLRGTHSVVAVFTLNV